MNYEEAVSYIHNFFRFGAKNGFDNISRLLNEYGNPHKTLRFIHIAGTNGKGSVTAMCAKVLQKAGYRVGMYISPYVIRFNERVQVNGEMIPDDELAALTTELSEKVNSLFDGEKMITQFEFITALGMIYFARKGCDVVCLEVGMGGRLDPTNVIPESLVSVIMSISKDHTKVLGDTIPQIAFEKCGIIKENSVTVSYPLQEPEALAVIMEQCAKKNNRLVIPGAASAEILEESVFGSVFCYGGKKIALSLAGRHQVYNALVVIEAMKILGEKGFCVSEEALLSGLAEVSFPARQELMGKNPLIILDGAHNPAGAKTLADTLRRLKERPLIGIVGVLSGKDYRLAAELTAPLFDALFTVKPEDKPGSPGIPARELAEYIGEIHKNVTPCRDCRQALEAARRAAGPDGAVVIYGSLYLASTMREILLEEKQKEQKLP